MGCTTRPAHTHTPPLSTPCALARIPICTLATPPTETLLHSCACVRRAVSSEERERGESEGGESEERARREREREERARGDLVVGGPDEDADERGRDHDELEAQDPDQQHVGLPHTHTHVRRWKQGAGSGDREETDLLLDVGALHAPLARIHHDLALLPCTPPLRVSPTARARELGIGSQAIVFTCVDDLSEDGVGVAEHAAPEQHVLVVHRLLP
eukprot:1073511-Rhodomonas_salina.1